MKKKNTTQPFERRSFLKSLLAVGASTSAMSLTGALLQPQNAMANLKKTFNPDEYKITRNACPRNCFDTCSIKSYVKDGILQFVEGAEESTFTKGALCVKGYTYPRRIYSPDRIKYPMRQTRDAQGKRSGKWERISWEQAMDIISDKILELKKEDGNLLGLGMTKYSGNFGITNYCVEGLMTSLGYTSRFVGTPCWPAGIDAQSYDFGDIWNNDPEDMEDSRYIILWGANPAWCSMHSVKYIDEAKKRGAKVVCIDPILTQTAAKSDLYLQVKTAGDGALALGMARHILDNNLYDADFVNNHTLGFDEFADYLKYNVTLAWAEKESGIPVEEIKALAEEFAQAKPATIWVGYGLQRHVNGGATVRSIDALAALTGNIGMKGAGARYAQLRTWGFNYHAMLQKTPEGSIGVAPTNTPKGEFDVSTAPTEYSDRTYNINKTAQDLLDSVNPKIRMMWISCKNVFAQDFDRNKIQKAFDQLDMVVSVEQFFTETVKNSDIVLPVTTLFEEWTVNASYWHYWLSINEQAIEPMHEAKSNLHIAAALSKAMNAKEEGSCTYPQDIDEKEWTGLEFNQNIYKMLGIKTWEELLDGPKKANPATYEAWFDKTFATPSNKYEFKSELCREHGLNDLPVFVMPRKATAPYRLLTPHVQFALHSQFVNLDWTEPFYSEPHVFLNKELALIKGIKEDDIVRVHNDIGEVIVKAKFSTNIDKNTLVMYEAWFKELDYNVENLVDDTSSDMGAWKTGAPGVAIHSQFADIELYKG